MALQRLQVHIMLHRMRNWQIRLMPDASGHECLHYCIPCDENGIELIASTIRDEPVMRDGSNTRIVSWNMLAFPNTSYRGNLYALIPSMPKDMRDRLAERGIIDPNSEIRTHPFVGNITACRYPNSK